MSGVPAWAYRGAKVVCVDDRLGIFDQPGRHYVGDMDGLTKGRVYTILGFSCDFYQRDVPTLVLEEIDRGAFEGVVSGYDVSRFRPLITRSQEDDLAIFRPILDQVPVDA